MASGFWGWEKDRWAYRKPCPASPRHTFVAGTVRPTRNSFAWHVLEDRFARVVASCGHQASLEAAQEAVEALL